MNGKRELLDSNILIYLSRQELSLADVIKPDTEYSISVVSYMEVFGYPFARPAEEELVLEIVSRLEIVDVTLPIAQQTIVNQKRHHVDLPDAIIGATAQVLDCVLVTRNVDDFKTIEGLKIVNPFESLQQKP